MESPTVRNHVPSDSGLVNLAHVGRLVATCSHLVLSIDTNNCPVIENEFVRFIADVRSIKVFCIDIRV